MLKAAGWALALHLVSTARQQGLRSDGFTANVQITAWAAGDGWKQGLRLVDLGSHGKEAKRGLEYLRADGGTEEFGECERCDQCL